MTALEACGLVVDLTRELSSARSERDVYRQIAIAGIHHSHDLQTRLRLSEDRYQRALADVRGLRQQLLSVERRAA
jgi:hypothetical protein